MAEKITNISPNINNSTNNIILENKETCNNYKNEFPEKITLQNKSKDIQHCDHYSYYTDNTREIDKKRAEATSISPKFVEVLFKCKRKKIYRNDLKLPLSPTQFVIVEMENGIDIGVVSCTGNCIENRVKNNNCDEPTTSIVRIANEEDINIDIHNINEAVEILSKARSLITLYKIDMKITEAEWQFDHQRLTIYFTAPQRVDFRDLVKELARTFRTRIELRQISIREEAKRLGGVGPCGRTICCNSLSCDFNHITLEHAKTQQLSNNINKLSGYCGRLKCCLLYEHETYTEAFKDCPPIGSFVELPEGNAKIIKIDAFKNIVNVYFPEKNQYASINKELLIELDREGKVQRTNDSCAAVVSDLDDADINELLELEKEY